MTPGENRRFDGTYTYFIKIVSYEQFLWSFTSVPKESPLSSKTPIFCPGTGVVEPTDDQRIYKLKNYISSTFEKE
jgi:hypothetical protein